MLWKGRTRVVLTLAALLSMGIGGCTRRFFRDRADKEVTNLLASKDHHEDWKIEFWRPYPDPKARFASPGNQDLPAMPEDDPAARLDSPNPQDSKRAGYGALEGTGYLEILEQFDRENRELEKRDPDKPDKELLPAPRSGGNSKENVSEIQTVLFQEGQQNRPIPLGTTSDYPEQGARRYPDLETEPGMGENELRNPLKEDRQPFRLNIAQACELALVNSREYMTRREDVYLAALPVTLQRFSFMGQFFATESAVRSWYGPQYNEYPNGWTANSNTGFTKVFSSGALLLFQFANRLVFETGKGSNNLYVTPSFMSLQFFQPLLQGGGKAVTLEPLTISERELLYSIRYYARFRKEFFTYLIGGGTLQRQGLISANAPRTLSINEMGAGAIASQIQVRPGQGSGYQPGPGQFDAPNQGYLALLLQTGILVNQQENVKTLGQFFEQYKEFQAIGDIPELQVARVRQQLLQSQIQVIQSQQIVRDAMDQFKLQMGLPPVLPIQLDDHVLRQPMEQLDRFQKLTDELKNARKAARLLRQPELAKKIRGEFQKILLAAEVVKHTKYKDILPAKWGEYAKFADDKLIAKVREIGDLRKAMRDKSTSLEKAGKKLSLEELIKLRAKEKAGKKLSLDEKLSLEDWIKLRATEFELFLGRFERSLRIYERETFIKNGKIETIMQKELFEDLEENFLLLFVEPRNERLDLVREEWAPLPKLCVDGVNFLGEKTSLGESLWTAGRHALAHRLDLMNGRAQLVDSWRQIRVAANSLLGVFNVGYNWNANSPLAMAQPLSFQSMGVHQLTLNAEAPLVRIAERNNYRAVLINWQRMRRNLMAFEDTILLNVRNEVRQLRALARNYTLQKEAVDLAYLVLDNAVESIYQPKPPGAPGQDFVALTQQLLQAQQQKLQAQNQLLTIWVTYQSVRLTLYRDLELMPLDARGVWTDDITTSQCCPDENAGDSFPADRVPDAPRLLPRPTTGP